MLTVAEIRGILEGLAWETLYEYDIDGIRLQKKSPGGYSEDHDIGVLQAKLSIMLEVATKMEGA